MRICQLFRKKKMTKIDFHLSSDEIDPFSGISSFYSVTLKESATDEQIETERINVIKNLEFILELASVREYSIVSHLRRQ